MSRFHTFVIATVLAAIPAFAAAQNPTGQTGGYFLRGKVTAFDGHQPPIAAAKQSVPGQEHKCQRHLRHRQRRTDPVRRPSGSRTPSR